MPITHAQVLPEAGDPAVPGEPGNVNHLSGEEWNDPHLVTGVIAADGFQFPATQVASADENTLDDYEEGEWTPVLTFSTPGDLSVVYGTQVGTYRKIGGLVVAHCHIITTTFTYGSASGQLRITGLPFTVLAGENRSAGGIEMEGWTLTGVATLVPRAIQGDTYFEVRASRSGATVQNLRTNEIATGATVKLNATVVYFAA